MTHAEQFRDVVRAGGLTPPRPDPAVILAGLSALFAADEVIELRAFAKGKKRTDAGYFDGAHRDLLADEAARLNAAGAAVYVTLNRLEPQLLSRYCNRVESFAAATATDLNVIRRRWLLLDFDPTRPKDTSATDAQVRAARDKARECHQFLKAEGWPAPLAAESGNGWHLLYRLDLPNDDAARDLVRGVLAGLAARFDDDVIKLDQSVFNAGRIVKLYGTVATKGDHTEATPWRLSRLVSKPSRDAAVTVEQLRALHPTPPPPTAVAAPNYRASPGLNGFDLVAFLERLAIAYTLDQHEGVERYKLAHCPFNPEHGHGEAAIFKQPGGRLGFKCQHNSCANRTWQDVRALVDGTRDGANRALRDAKAPDGLPEQPGAPDVTAAPEWPAALDPAALHGIAGEFVRAVEPNTEADPAAILLQFLVAFGALVGRGPHFRVEGDQHHANLFALLVGATAKGRKGTSWGRVREALELVADWKPHVSGLSSGEGLKWAVRDAREETKRSKNGEIVTEIVDEGVTDKRLLVIESEFASALRAVQRQGNTLSATVREAWDTGNLRTLTKNDPITATGAHICIVGHVTADELRAELTATDSANGFANRFLFVAVRRSKLLPFGGARADEAELRAFAGRLAELVGLARSRGRLAMSGEARRIWATVYPALSAGGDGLHGAVTARAEAQCIRLALVYALLDGAAEIDAPHLMAALAVWQYCDATARHVFGASLGDRIADEIMRRLRAAGDVGMTRTDIRDAFGRHQSVERIGAALELLRRKGSAQCATEQTGGRPVEVWRATKAT